MYVRTTRWRLDNKAKIKVMHPFLEQVSEHRAATPGYTVGVTE